MTSCLNQRNKSGSDSGRKAPRLVLGGDSAFMEMVAEQLRDRGWDVHTAAPTDAVKAAIRRNAHAVVLRADGDAETGYLTALKLRTARPKGRVVLIGERTAKAEGLARFVGADFVAEGDGLRGLLTAFASAPRS